MRKNGRIEEVPLRGSPISKIGSDISYAEEIVGIYPDDKIIFYTDGIIEEKNIESDEEFGVQGLRKVIAANFEISGKELCRKIILESERYSEAKAKDDRSIMVATII